MTMAMGAKMKVSPQKRQELLRTLAIMEDLITLEPGCIGWRLSQDKDDENLLFLTLEWQSQECLDKYLESSQHRVFWGALQVLCEHPVIAFRTNARLPAQHKEVVSLQNKPGSQDS